VVLLPLIRHPGDFRAVFSLPLNVFIAPFSSPRQSSSRGPWFLKASGFPTKDFGNDKKRRSSPLNGFIRGPQYLKAFGFPIKDFGNDGKGGRHS